MVKIAFMRSLGRRGYHHEGWEKTFGGPNPDYILFRLVFPFFDKCTSTRLCTGTPYGPVDIIPWDTPLSKLVDYEVVVYIGSEGFCMDDEQYANLKEFVRRGGKLVIPVGQMRTEEGEFYKGGDYLDFLGVRVKGWRKMCLLKPEQERLFAMVDKIASGTRVLRRLDNGIPLVVGRKFGRGEVFLFLSPFLTSYGEEEAERIIRPLLSEAKWLEFSPESDWLEYMVQKKGESYIIPIFNHGRGFFPSGNGYDYGPWEGEVKVDLEELGLSGEKLEVCRVVYNPKAPVPFTLNPLRFSVVGDTLSFKITVDEFQEVVLGPAKVATNEYFDWK